MVKKQEVLDYYAEKMHRPHDEYWHVPPIVEYTLNSLPEDENGIYWLIEDAYDIPREYLTMEEVKGEIRKSIDAIIKDLLKIKEL